MPVPCAAGATPAGPEPAGAEPAGAEIAGPEPTGAEPAGAEIAGAEPAGAETTEAEIAGAEPAGMPPLTDDGFLGRRLAVLQPARGYRAGLDAVFLAAAPVAPGLVLDAGAGAGVVSLCLAWRVPGVRCLALEADPALVRLAERNAARNGLGGRVSAQLGDLLGPLDSLRRAGPAQEAAGDIGPALRPGAFDHVVTNPPFHAPGTVQPPGDAGRARAQVAQARLDDWVRRCCVFLKPGGGLTVIHPAEALADLLAAMSVRCGALEVFCLWPRPGLPARRVIVRGRLGSRTPLRLLPGMVLHQPCSAWTAEAQAVLHGGALWPSPPGALP